MEESACAINLKKLKEEELKRKGYNAQDIGLLNSLKEMEKFPEILEHYLEIYIHNKVMYENQNKKLKESVLVWWKEHKDDIDTGRHSEYNVYDEVPDFVKIAMGRR
ncbi:hypothetical protein G9F71_008600 [Clostridium sp. FP2]|uniref:hypothetical protein n=1 Tax=Clostridium sp. FP2 TaxID=2724481 RepID=UPI0013E98D19|nr:hypothetical protein [Clostridium sp. FP2]MBZ9622912.1 hypothetical protein [Clostridium sp. FP2]